MRTTVSDISRENKANNDLIHTFMNMIKGLLGIGVLAIPNALRHSGMAVGLVTLLVVFVLESWSLHVFMECCGRVEDYWEDNGVARDEINYQDVVYYSFVIGLDSQRLGRVFGLVANFFLVVIQLGCCSIYVIFVADNSRQTLNYYSYFDFRPCVYYLGTVSTMLIFVFITDLRQLAACSLFANISGSISLIIVFLFFFPSLQIVKIPMATDFMGFAIFFGVVIFSLEGNGLNLPIRNKMADKSLFTGLFGVFNVTMSLVTLVNLAVGFYGLLRFGDATCSSITLNLPVNILSITAKMLYIASIFLSFGLQLYVPVQIISPLIFSLPFFRKTFVESGRQLWGECLLRFVLIILIAIPAILIPYLDLMISLMGSICCSFLTFLLPAIANIAICWKDGGLRGKTILSSSTLLAFGLFGMLFGTFSTLRDIIRAMSGRLPIDCH